MKVLAIFVLIAALFSAVMANGNSTCTGLIGDLLCLVEDVVEDVVEIL